MAPYLALESNGWDAGATFKLHHYQLTACRTHDFMWLA
jgi:hypothetical protein